MSVFFVCVGLGTSVVLAVRDDACHRNDVGKFL